MPQPLRQALQQLAAHGKRTPCQADPAPFTSDDPADRREASQACLGCPVLTACRHHADTLLENWHVWAGEDRTNHRKKNRSP